MAGTPTQPSDLNGLSVGLLGKSIGVDMTATNVVTLFTNGPNTALCTAIILENFSSFPAGSATPATWAFSVGTDSATVPVNMRAAAAATAASTVIPIVWAFALGTTTLSQYVAPGGKVYFAVSTATNGLGTFDVKLIGGILTRSN
jgi:hypothetical protein